MADSDNSIYLINNNGKTKVDNVEGFNIKFSGVHNVVEIYCSDEELRKFQNCNIRFRDNGLTVIKPTCYSVSNMDIDIESDSKFILGKNTFSYGFTVACKRNTSCIIGDGSFIGTASKFRTSDAHKLYDKNGVWLNPPADIVIGNHVWIGQECLILKKTVVPDNCVIGARSLLNKEYKTKNALLVGSPAVIKKRNISWEP